MEFGRSKVVGTGPTPRAVGEVGMQLTGAEVHPEHFGRAATRARKRASARGPAGHPLAWVLSWGTNSGSTTRLDLAVLRKAVAAMARTHK